MGTFLFTENQRNAELQIHLGSRDFQLSYKKRTFQICDQKEDTDSSKSWLFKI